MVIAGWLLAINGPGLLTVAVAGGRISPEQAAWLSERLPLLWTLESRARFAYVADGCERVDGMEPSGATAALWYGFCLERLGREGEAAAVWRRVGAENWFLLQARQQGLQRETAAQRVNLDRARRVAPGSPEPDYALARALEAEDPGLASALYLEGARKDPLTARALYMRARAAAARRDHVQALDLLQDYQAAALLPDEQSYAFDAWLLAGEQVYLLYEPAGSLGEPSCLQLRWPGPGRAVVALSVGSSLAAAGGHQRALRWYAYAVRLDPALRPTIMPIVADLTARGILPAADAALLDEPTPDLQRGADSCA
jgi:tetratricopeptide (TPR) repeat protein